MRTQFRSTTPPKKNYKSQAQGGALQAWHSASSEAQPKRSASSGATAALAARLQGANKHGNVNSPREGKQPQICAKCEASLELTFLAIVSSITWGVGINEAITRLGTHPSLFHSADGCRPARTFVKWLRMNIGSTSLFNPEPAFGMALNMSRTKTDTPTRERRREKQTNIDVHPRARRGRSSPQ